MQFSASISGFCRTVGVFDAMKEVKLAGYDGVDFPFSHYARTPSDPLCNDRWWRLWTQTVGTYSEELALPVVQAHAPWGQTIPSDLHYEAPSCLYARVFEACKILSCKKLVFHLLQYPYRIVSAEQLSAIHAYNLRWVRELLPLAEQYGVTIELENTFDYYHLRMPSDIQEPYVAAEQLVAFSQALASERIGFCLDTGHANIAEQDIPTMIQCFADKLECLHLNDNFGRRSGQNEDVHLFPGDGTISWHKVAAALRQNDYHGVMNLEIIADLSACTSAQRVEKLRQGKLRVQSFMQL